MKEVTDPNLLQTLNNNPQQQQPQQQPKMKEVTDPETLHALNEDTSSVGAFFKGATKNFDEYASSVNKGLDNVADFVTGRDTKFFEDNKDYWNKQSDLNDIETANHPYARLGGQILLDPINLTPTGIVKKGQTLGRIGEMLTKTKPRAVATSMVTGAAVGAGTTAFKDYGNDNYTQAQKNENMAYGAGIVSVINGIISGVTKGKVNDAIKPDMFNGANADEVINAIMKNPEHFGLDKDQANEVVQGVVLQGKYPKVDEKYRREQAGFKQQYTPNFQMRPNHPPATMDKQMALSVLAKEADRKRTEQGLQPIYQRHYEVPEQYRKESVYPQQPEQPYNPNFVSGDFNNNIPVPYNADAELMQRYHKVASHPRLQELLQMREGVKAKDAASPQRQVSKGGYRELAGYSGENKHAYDFPQNEKNYNYDFHLTKQDIGKLYKGQYDDNLLSKLETDLDTLDNHPDYAEPTNNIDYSKYKEDNTHPQMNEDDWKEANELFAKGIDNLAVGTYAGVGQDENGNITFDPEKFILGLGGYTAVKQALKNGTIRGKLKEIATDAINKVNFNPEIQKDGNSFNSMFVGANSKNDAKSYAKKSVVDLGGHDITKANFGDKNGELEIFEKSPYAQGRNSINHIEIPDNLRRTGKGTELLNKAKNEYDNISAQASNENSVRFLYKNGFRPTFNKDLSVDDAIKAFKENGSSLNMEWRKGIEKGVFSDTATKKTMKEIDDSKAKVSNGTWGTSEDIKIGNSTVARLDEILDHKELFEKYPELKNIIVHLKPDIQGASFDADSNKIVVGYDTKTKSINKSSLLHEIQHSIQDKEGWARGGSPDNIHPKDMYETIISKYGNLPAIEKIENDFLNSKIPTENEMYEKVINMASNNYGGIEKLKYDTYRRLHGEQQARATQHRMDYTPEQRQGEDWTKTLKNVEGEYKEPIIKYDDGINEMSPVKSKAQKEKRGIYNVTFNGKNSTQVRKADSEELIRYAKGNKKQGAIHIQKHLKDGSIGEISKEELLNIGDVIRNGRVYENNGKNVYEIEKDGIRYRAIVGKGKNDTEKIITFYSNKNMEDKKGYDISLITNNLSSHKVIIPQKDKKDLLIHHNLTQDNLKFADDNGGLAVPSLATTKKDNPIDGFGDVTLLGDEALAKPKRDHQVYGADIYSPRYPKIENKLKVRDERNIVKELQPYHEMVGRYAEVNTDDLADDIVLQLKFLDDKGEDLNKLIKHDRPSDDAIQRYEALKSFYEDGLMNRDYANNPKFIEKVKEILKSKIGNEINDWTDTQINRVAKTYAGEMKVTLRKLEKGSTPDYYATRREVSSTIGNKYNSEYKQFVRDYYKSHNAEEKIYNGTDNQGRQKWQPHTLDNVVKKLKKDLRGGESFNYGTGSLRAKFTPQFKTLAQIRKAKDKLVSSEEFEKVKKEVEDEYFNLQSKFQEYHENKSFDFENTFNGLIEDSIDSPIEKELRDYGFKNVPKELISELENFKNALRDMPTEYFESKVLRAMDLKEFKHAIIPSDASETTKNILKKNGIDFTEYDKNLPQDRIKKIKETAEKNGYLFANGMHSMAGGFFGGADSLINQRDYNGDGKYDYKDLLAGVAAGTISINTLKKLAPKLFEEEAGGVKAGLFAGSKAKGFRDAEDAGKTFYGKYDTLDRFEIDDSKAKLKATPKELNSAIRKRLAQEKDDVMNQYESGAFSEEEAKKLLEDNLNKMPIEKDGTHKLSEILDHKELFDNYPKLYDTKVTFTEMPKGANGYFDKKANEIVLNSNMSDKDIKSSLLHEIQHAIQKEEGFARGGSAQEFYNDFKSKIDLLKYELEFEPDDFIRDKKLKQLSELERKYKNGGKEEAFKMYQNLAGEIEARDVQARADFTPEQRAKTEPYSSENISRDDAVMKFNGDESLLNMSESKEALKTKLQEAKKKGYEHLSKIVSQETQKEWGDAANSLKRWFTDTLGAKYHDLRESATASTNGMSVKLERMHHALKELREADRTSLHEYVAGESKEINPALKPLADSVKKQIDDMSKELIDLGVLTKEQYDEWAGYYIHRNYEEHFFKDIKGMMKKGFKIDDIHKRGNIEEITATQAKKLLIDPKFIASTKLPLRDGGQRLTKKANGKYELRRDWTKEEREAMKEITDGAITIPETLMRLKRMADNATFLKNVSNIDEVVLKDAEKFTDEEIKASGFTKVPNNPKYGVLAGKHIRKDVFSDISARNDEIYNTFRGENEPLARIWKNYLSLWKKSKTVWNAPSHLNNLLSNTYLMHLAGMRADEITVAFGKAGKMMYHGDTYEKLLQKKMIGKKLTQKEEADIAEMGENLKYYFEAKDSGLFGRSQLNDILAGKQNKIKKRGVLGKIDKFSEDMYHGEDEIGKLAMYSHLREKVGMSSDEARKAVLTIIPDYSKPMPAGYRFLRDTGISPFISWSYYTMPAIWKLMKTKQGAKKATIAMGTLSAMEYALTGGAVTPLDNLPFVNTDKPEDFKGRRFGIGRNGDKITTIKTDRWIPYIELMNPINFAISNVSGVTTNAVVNTLTAPSSAGMINPYYGRPITYKNKSAGQKTYDYAKYLTQSYVPAPAQLYTGWNMIESLARSKKNRRTNKVIEPRTPVQEALKNIGLNSLSYSKSALKKEQQKNK